MMRRKVHTVLAVLSWCWTAVAGAGAATHLDNVTVGYASFSGHYTPMWIAVEDALGKKYGIDLKAVYAGRMRPQQLLMSGDVPMVIATGSGALTSHIVGAKDQVIVANFINKVGGAIYSKPEIKTPEDLRGKTIGVGRAGSISDSVIRYVLRAKLGLVPDHRYCKSSAAAWTFFRCSIPKPSKPMPMRFSMLPSCAASIRAVSLPGLVEND